MDILKILVTGTFASPKINFIRKLTDIDTLFAELEGVTIGLDFGMKKIDRSTQIHLFSTPAVKRFDADDYAGFLNDSSRRGMVLMVDPAEHSERYGDVKDLLTAARKADMPCVIAISCWDDDEATSDDSVKAAIGVTAKDTVLKCNVDSSADVRDVVMALVEQIPQDGAAQKIRAKLAAG